MYVGWADGRGMRIRRNGAIGDTVLDISGLGAYTLLKSEAGLHVLELPHDDDRGFDRVTALVEVEPAGAELGRESRRARHRPTVPPRASPLVRDASGMRTGRIDRVLAGDFDLLGDAAPA